eukprot:Nk52_evm28s304 gene=Nk52_evmTU28s304
MSYNNGGGYNKYNGNTAAGNDGGDYRSGNMMRGGRDGNQYQAPHYNQQAQGYGHNGHPYMYGGGMHMQHGQGYPQQQHPYGSSYPQPTPGGYHNQSRQGQYNMYNQQQMRQPQGRQGYYNHNQPQYQQVNSYQQHQQQGMYNNTNNNNQYGHGYGPKQQLYSNAAPGVGMYNGNRVETPPTANAKSDNVASSTVAAAKTPSGPATPVETVESAASVDAGVGVADGDRSSTPAMGDESSVKKGEGDPSSGSLELPSSTSGKDAKTCTPPAAVAADIGPVSSSVTSGGTAEVVGTITGDAANCAPPSRPARPTTVFVNGIVDVVDNEYMRELLSICGTVNSFKRMKGVKGKLQAFGFCEFENPEAAHLALRLLDKLPLGGKRLELKTDQKTTAFMENYFRAKMTAGLEESQGPSDQEVISKIGALAAKKNGELNESVKVDISEGIHNIRSRGTANSSPTSARGSGVINEELATSKLAGDGGKGSVMAVNSDNVDTRVEGRACEILSSAESKENKSETFTEEKLEKWNKILRERVQRYVEDVKRDRDDEFHERERRFMKKESERQREIELIEKKDKSAAQDKLDAANDMLEFLSSYDDERDDKKYYSDHKMDLLWHERERELKLDEKDKQEELRAEEERKQHLEREERLKKEKEMQMQDKAKEKEENVAYPQAPEGRDSSLRQVSELNGMESNVDKEKRGLDEENSTRDGSTKRAKTVGPSPMLENAHGEESLCKDGLEEKVKSGVKSSEKVSSLLNIVPREKEALFAFSIDYNAMNSSLQQKLNEWVKHEISVFLGEDEPDLRNFICEQVLNKLPPTELINEISMVMDDESDSFVQKLWGFLIYETELSKRSLL